MASFLHIYFICAYSPYMNAKNLPTDALNLNCFINRCLCVFVLDGGACGEYWCGAFAHTMRDIAQCADGLGEG